MISLYMINTFNLGLKVCLYREFKFLGFRCTKKNSCLQVLKGSHKMGRINHNLSGDQAGADLERLQEAKEMFPLVYVEMDPGDALFFHCNLLHSRYFPIIIENNWIYEIFVKIIKYFIKIWFLVTKIIVICDAGLWLLASTKNQTIPPDNITILSITLSEYCRTQPFWIVM